MENKFFKKFFRSLLLLITLASIGGASAMADTLNDRPIMPLGDADLQVMFSNTNTDSPPGIYAGGIVYDAVLMQSPQAVFSSTGSGGSISRLFLQSTPLSGLNEMGIYDVTNPSRKITLFDGSATLGDQALVSFLADGTLVVNLTLPGVPGFSGNFGFYLDVYGADGNDATLDYTIYTEDSLNPSGAAQALIYQGNGQSLIQIPTFPAGAFTENEWIIAFEDGVGPNSDYDFSDFVFIAESLAPGFVERQTIGCRVTAGGVDEFGYWTGEYEEGLSYWIEFDEPDRYHFGGQVGANTALPPDPAGEWEHHQQKGPSGSFSFHGGTNSAPAGTRIVEIRCSDPGGCSPSGNPPSPNKQLDFDGIGTFQNIGNGKSAPVWLVADPNVAKEPKGNKSFAGTFHWFEVNLDDLGEPGNSNSELADTELCPIPGFG